MLDSYKSLFFAQNPSGLARARKPIRFFLCTIHFERVNMPGKSRPTGNTTTDSGYNNSSSQTNLNTQSPSSSRECKRLFTLSRFSFLKHLTSFSFLLFQHMTRAALFYDEEGKQVSISLQGDHRNLSSCSLQGNAFAPIFLRKCDSLVRQLKWDDLTGENSSFSVLQKPRHFMSSYLLSA